MVFANTQCDLQRELGTGRREAGEQDICIGQTTYESQPDGIHVCGRETGQEHSENARRTGGER